MMQVRFRPSKPVFEPCDKVLTCYKIVLCLSLACAGNNISIIKLFVGLNKLKSHSPNEGSVWSCDSWSKSRAKVSRLTATL